MKTDFDYSALGERIRKARKQKGLTQEQLAEACNLSTAHIGHIERGTRALSLESLITISRVLNVGTDYLLLDISPSSEKRLSDVLDSVVFASDEKYERLYSIVRILAENMDKL